MTTSSLSALDTQMIDSPGKKPEKLHALTSLRFFAAFYVVLLHTLTHAVPSYPQEGFQYKIFLLGYVSVDFFFLLSGYILAVVYLSSGKVGSNRNFFAARFARIYPLFFLTLVLDTPNLFLVKLARHGLMIAIGQISLCFIGSAFMLQTWIPRLGGIDGPNWSLSVETVFYLLFPWIGCWLWRLNGRQAIACSIALWLVNLGIAASFLLHFIPEDFKANPLTYIPTFSLGILLARWQFLERQKQGASPKYRINIALALSIALVSFLAVTSVSSTMPFGSISHGVLSPIYCCLIWSFSSNKTLFSRLLNTRFLVVLGEASYGLYLIHIPMYHIYSRLPPAIISTFYPLYLISCIGLSVLSFYWIETPSRKWILQRLHARSRENMEMASDAQ